MKAHTNNFKNTIKKFGRELDSIITYTLNNEQIELGNDNLNSVTPHYEGAILKSVMKQLDIDSNIDIPIGTELNYQFGIKVANEQVEDYRENYEYLDYGNYIVYSSEKQEDTNSYKIICYDKMLYSMKDYENMNITYPITIRNYINTICNHLGLTFANSGDIFANYNREIQLELYLDVNGNSLGYTFRDVLDEIAQATASTICINENGQLEIRYINNTGDTIDEEYLKDINVNFGEQYGPINTIVLSRSAGADKIYKSYPDDLPDEEKNSIEIADNQIMNFNDRDTYLPDILNKLYGLQYYINDFTSTGICYYDLCDRYNISIGENTYSCVMLNDETNITQGLEEKIYTVSPEESITDYTKADKTDRRINQTYLIVDKQNQEISAVVSQTIDPNNPESAVNQVSRLNIKVGELESEISNISGMVMTQESELASVSFTDTTTESEPITIKLHPIGKSISNVYSNNYLYPSSQDYPAKQGLKPSESLLPSDIIVPSSEYPAQHITYPKNRRLLFHNNTTDEDIFYLIPDDLLYYDSENFDELYVDINSRTCQITKKCKWNTDGTIGLLSNPRVDEYEYPLISLTEGVYTVSIEGYEMGYIYITLMAKNIYTDQFYTKVETDSKITQTANEINATVSLKLDEEEFTHANIVLKINDSTSLAQIEADKINITANDIINIIAGNTLNLTSKSITISSTNFNVTTDGNITAKGGTIGGWTISDTALYTSSNNYYLGTTGITATIGGTSRQNIIFKAGNNFGVNSSGNLYANQAILSSSTITGTLTCSGTISGGIISGSTITGGSIDISKGNGEFYFNMGTTTSHPNCSGLNVRDNININGLGFRNDGGEFLFAGGVKSAYITATSQFVSDGNAYVYGGLKVNNINPSGVLNLLSGGSTGSASNTGILIRSGAGHITIDASNGGNNYSYYAYVRGGSLGTARIATDSSGPSSKCLKQKIVKYKSNEFDEALDLLKDINIYNYEYKYKIHDKKEQYGFIIDDLLENKLADKFLYFKDEKATINDNNSLDYLVEDNDKNVISFKRYDEETLVKYLLVVCKALQNKVDKLEKEK